MISIQWLMTDRGLWLVVNKEFAIMVVAHNLLSVEQREFCNNYIVSYDLTIKYDLQVDFWIDLIWISNKLFHVQKIHFRAMLYLKKGYSTWKAKTCVYHFLKAKAETEIILWRSLLYIMVSYIVTVHSYCITNFRAIIQNLHTCFVGIIFKFFLSSLYYHNSLLFVNIIYGWCYITLI
jgi:hypothetical protein